MEQETGLSLPNAGVTGRVNPSWHTPLASEIAVFATFEWIAFAETLFGTGHEVRGRVEQVDVVKKPGKIGSLRPLRRFSVPLLLRPQGEARDGASISDQFRPRSMARVILRRYYKNNLIKNYLYFYYKHDRRYSPKFGGR
jgi:hypothetical protein